jgi:UDP-N-acetylglucosamine acyltransferase
MVGGQAHITKDVPPFVTVDGATSLIVGLNTVGLRRGGLSREELDELKEAYRIVFRRGLRWKDALDELRVSLPSGRAAEMLQFLEQTQRGCVQERRLPRGASLKLVANSTGEHRLEQPELRRQAS